jgi:tripartite-type tricarboxylate transporter receptor subunit TctC
MLKNLLYFLAFIIAPACANESIKIVVPYAPGGPADLIARAVQKDLAQALGKSIIVDYKQGAGGDVGAAAVADSDANKTVLLIHSVGLVINQAAKKSTYNEQNLRPLFNLGTQPLVLVVPKNSALTDLPTWQQLKPDAVVNYGSSGVGSSTHIAGEILTQKLGKKLNHIPYRGQGQVIPGLLSNTIDAAFLFAFQAVPYIQSGQLIAVAVVSPQRLSSLPNVPTFSELGITDLDFRPWWVVISNNSSNQRELELIQQSLQQILINNKDNQVYKSLGLEEPETSRILPRDFLIREKSRFSTIIKQTNISLE